MECRVDGCGKKARYTTAQVCQTHYFRLWRNGTLDIVRKPARPRIYERGYTFVHAPHHPLTSPGQIYIAEHRAVLYEKIGPGPMSCELCGVSMTWKTCQSDHIDQNRANNDPSNLRPLCRRCNVWRSMPPAKDRLANVKVLTFDGISQSAHEWSRDPRVKVTSATIRRRLQAGMSDEDALFSRKITHNTKQTKKPKPSIQQEITKADSIIAEYRKKRKELETS